MKKDPKKLYNIGFQKKAQDKKLKLKTLALICFKYELIMLKEI